MRIFYALLLAAAVCSSAICQDIVGTTTMRIDPNSITVTATCETALNSADSGYYAARVLCWVKDQSGNYLASGAYSDDGDRQGSAAVTLSFTGVPGKTYTATGTHSAALEVPFDAPPPQPRELYDEYNFESYAENPQTYYNSYNWYGPGPEMTTRASVLHIGNTQAVATAPQKCPSGVTLASEVSKSLPDADYPSFLTGVGILTRMVVTPQTTDFTGTVLLGQVIPGSNSCPANIQ